MGKRTIMEAVKFYGEVVLVIVAVLGLFLGGVRFFLLDTFVTKAEAAEYAKEADLDKLDRSLVRIEKKIDDLLIRK